MSNYEDIKKARFRCTFLKISNEIKILSIYQTTTFSLSSSESSSFYERRRATCDLLSLLSFVERKEFKER